MKYTTGNQNFRVRYTCKQITGIFVESSSTYLLFFSTTTPTPSHRRVVIFLTTTQGIWLQRQVDVFFPRRRQYDVPICSSDGISIFSVDLHLCWDLFVCRKPPFLPCRTTLT